jgi:transposase
MLTDLEAVFRSLKSEFGLRPIFHHKTDRVCGHLFISVLAYHVVHVIRSRLKMRIPRISATCSRLNRPPIPQQIGHLFQVKSATDSRRIRLPIGA